MEEFLLKKKILKCETTRLENKFVSQKNSEHFNIEVFLSLCKKLHDDATLALNQLASKASDDEFNTYYDELSGVQDRIEKLMCELHNLKVTTVVEVKTQPSRCDSIQLPQLKLPTFDGQLNQWFSFRDLFIASVHNNDNLTPAQKLQYLKSSVTGVAASLISTLSVTNSNYGIAWDLLNHRYQNKRVMVNDILKRFVHQPAVKPDSATDLRNLVDTTSECIQLLNSLEVPTTSWDPILVFHVIEKLDAETRKQWELSFSTSDLPTYNELCQFLDQRANALAAASSVKQKLNKQCVVLTYSEKRASAMYSSSAAKSKCVVCQSEHELHKCETFTSMLPTKREQLVKSKKLCFNCLRSGHSSYGCKYSSCKVCHKKHHTLLHFQDENNVMSSDSVKKTDNTVNSYIASDIPNRPQRNQVLLATALIKVKDKYGDYKLCRALCDSASEVSFITERCVQKLGLRKYKSDITISGINNVTAGVSKHCCNVEFQSRFNNCKHCVQTFVIPKITGLTPKLLCSNSSVWKHLQNLDLADPSYNVPQHVDILLGADIFSSLITGEKRTGPKCSPVAIKSSLGWILMGKTNIRPRPTSNASVFFVSCSVDSELKRFWELEEVPVIKHMSVEEQKCENYFLSSHRRDDSGRYIVRLPFTDDARQIGYSREQAVKRLLHCERKLATNPQYRNEYCDFMKNYLQLGHMEEITGENIHKKTSECFYLPHHSVINENSATTKLRVVFDGSAKSSTGVSLNDKLLVGPKLQDDLQVILLRFRTYQIALCSDLEKMYRQIKVDDRDADYQRIVWRDSSNHEIKNYKLVTVTYGTSCAPYLAIRCLQQLAIDEGTRFPLAKNAVLNDFYVDDLVSGSNSVEEAVELQHQLGELLKCGGFKIHKWKSSHSEVLSNVPTELQASGDLLNINSDQSVKMLGVSWSTISDEFLFTVVQPTQYDVLTKRLLMSNIAKLFDPLGFISPVTIRLKIILQSLWKLQLEWDDPVPQNISEFWLSYCRELHLLSEIRINRCIVAANAEQYQLVAFCDASENAYAAVVYLRSLFANETVSVKIVAAKTKVAPIKQVSLPRLELCGAVLLSRLVCFIKKAVKINFDSIYAFCDSTVVLSWISSSPSRWKTFVANRVSEIQSDNPEIQWSHVSSHENPADCASRGMNPSTFIEYSLWWSGPDWLLQPTLPMSPITEKSNLVVQEQKKNVQVLVSTLNNSKEKSLLDTYSTITRLQHVTAWCLRFVKNCMVSQGVRNFEPSLSPNELSAALNVWIKQVQNEEYKSEIMCLKNNKPLPAKSKLLCLNPFLDECGLVRVGGRLNNAQLTFSEKHPVLLPSHSRLTQLIIEELHIKCLHGGLQLVLSNLHTKYWIPRARDTVRRIIHQCVICCRYRGQTEHQLMADLPAPRVCPGRAFLRCGVDYCGPVLLKNIKSRSPKLYKAYISLFVCLATKAVHLELVSDSTTAAFIAALKRFISRRGKPTDIFCDCGTNFIGANRELNSAVTVYNSKVTCDFLADQEIKFHFNPPSAPHHGGLWEANVKCVKYHLHRIVQNAHLNYEEMFTVLCNIEACLNSRPLTPISSNPSDLSVLTPGHFLVGAPLLSIPEPELTSLKLNKLSRWQLTQQLSQHFWKRWSTEYLNLLQKRKKWRTPRPNIKVGDMVIVKHENTPPQMWKLARVTALHPGSDNLVRTVSIRTEGGVLKRPIVKLIVLPLDLSNEN